VGLGGNIGKSFAKQVLENTYDYFVLEVSSFQLDRCFSFQPDVAVLLNITPDHLDRYEYKFENYIFSKFRMFQNATEKTTCIYWADDEVIKQHLGRIPATQQKRSAFSAKCQRTNQRAKHRISRWNFGDKLCPYPRTP